ncbi:MAG: MFS transporter [Thermodesulfobacteriota bacterium]|nr:MFS transporter [Thermodesulfobacteriota bacterium]
MPLTREEKSWILYDVANSAFVLIVTTTLMPIFFKTYAARSMDPDTATSLWGFTVSAASFIVALAAPFLGTLGDYRGNKKRLFATAIITGVFATLLFLLIRIDQWLFCLILYAIARIGFAGANIFYDAFLVDITTNDRMDRISAYGFGWGYVGSVIPFLFAIAALLITQQMAGTAAFPASGFRIAFLITAIWWAVFSLPVLRSVRQVHFTRTVRNPVIDSLTTLANTLKQIKDYRPIVLFLIAYFFYIDGVYTIISMAMAYGMDLELGQPALIAVVLMIQVLGWPCAIVFGLLASRISARAMILAGIGIYAFLTFVAFLLPVIDDPGIKTILFFTMGGLIALAQGGIQSLSRSLFGKMIPKDRSAEFFGFYNIFGKFAAILGPSLMGLTTLLTGSSRYGVLSIMGLFIIGGTLLCFVREPSRNNDSPGRQSSD